MSPANEIAGNQNIWRLGTPVSLIVSISSAITRARWVIFRTPHTSLTSVSTQYKMAVLQVNAFFKKAAPAPAKKAAPKKAPAKKAAKKTGKK